MYHKKQQLVKTSSARGQKVTKIFEKYAMGIEKVSDLIESPAEKKLNYKKVIKLG